LRARLTPWEQTVFAAGAGLNLQSLFTLAIGLAGGLHQRWLLLAPTILAVLAAGVRLRTEVRKRKSTDGAPAPSAQRWRSPWLVLIVPCSAMLLLLAVLPPWEFDVREYHLQVPKEWFWQGRIDFLEHNVYGNMPLGAEMHALAAMMIFPGASGWWYGALSGKVLMASFTFLSAAALYGFGRRFFSPFAGAVAAILYLSIPWVLHVSSVGLVEGVLGTYLLLATYALALWWLPGSRHGPHNADAETSETQRARRGFVGLAGFLAGAAAACKYTGLVFVVLPLGAALVLAVAISPARWRLVVLYAAMVLAGCSLWYAKNAVLAGNPTYPLLYGVFGGRAWDEATNQRWKTAHGPQPDSTGRRFSWSQFVAALRDVGWFSDKLSPLMWPLAAFAVAAKKNRRLIIALALLVGLNFVSWWLLTHRYDRFFVPMFPLAALLAGAGASWTEARPWRWLIIGLLGVTTFLNLAAVSTGVLTGDNRMLASLESLRRDDDFAPSFLRMHPAHLFLNDRLRPGKKVLVVGEAQVFDLEVPTYYNTCWNTCLFEQWLKGRNREQRLQVLREHDVSHIFVHWSEIGRYQEPGNYGFTDYVTRRLVHEELAGQQRILRPVRVPRGEQALDPEAGEVFEVVYDEG
jgi:4-amino-4-deoxy-L-arabinose transferase-like glycosyltransferase